MFMWWLDLDEIDTLCARFTLLSRDRWNAFTFRDGDHLDWNGGRPVPSLKAALQQYARAQGCQAPIERVMLLTHLRTFGYLFNPISVYFAFGRAGEPVCAVAEVGNTYREMKSYFLGPETFQNGAFRRRTRKDFYVSPFIDLDAEFDFQLPVPGEKLALVINDYKEGRPFFFSSLVGRPQPITSGALSAYALRFPLMPLQVIFLIHWQALKLKLKGLPHHRKAATSHLQTEVQHARTY